MSGPIRTQLGILRKSITKSIEESTHICKQTDLARLSTLELETLANKATESKSVLSSRLCNVQTLITEWDSLISKDSSETAVQTEYFKKYGEVTPLLTAATSLEQTLDHLLESIKKERQVRIQSDSYISVNESPTVPLPTSAMTTVRPLQHQLPYFQSPPIAIKPFTGDSKEYTSFKNSFKAVYDNFLQDSVQKLIMLLSLLRGQPYQIINSLTICAANYETAFKLLDELYGVGGTNPQTLLNELLHMECLHPQNRSTETIRNTYITIHRICEQLKQHNINDNLTIVLTIKKIFPRWLTSKLPSNPSTTINDTLTAIRKQIEEIAALDTIYSSNNSATTLATTSSPRHINSNQRQQINNYPNNNRCSFRCTEPHNTFNCPLPTIKKRAIAKELKLCYNCLSPKHTLATCPSSKTCKTCSKRHHSVLHDDNYKRTTNTNHQQRQNRQYQPQHHQPQHHPNPVHQRHQTNYTTTFTPPTSHSSLFHQPPPTHLPPQQILEPDVQLQQPPPQTSTYHSNSPSNKQTLLCLRVKIVNPKTKTSTTSIAFIDCGSTTSYISTRAATELQLIPERSVTLALATFGNPIPEKLETTMHSVILENAHAKTGFQLSGCLTEIKHITNKITTILLPISNTPQMDSIVWRIPDAEEVQPDILIGSDLLFKFLDFSHPSFSASRYGNYSILRTLLGPIVVKTNSTNSITQNCKPVSTFSIQSTVITTSKPSATDISHLWDLSLLGIEPDSTTRIEDEVQQFFESTVIYSEDEKRYYVRYPTTINLSLPPSSIMRPYIFRKQMAMLQPIHSDDDLKSKYYNYFQELLSENMIERCPPPSIDELVSYITHFPVLNSDSRTTKVRPVLNPTEKLRGYLSLNEQLLNGTNLLPKIAPLLLRLRTFKNIVSGDIRKAFLTVGIQEEDRNLFRILLPENPKEPLSSRNTLCDYRFRRVPFGPRTSPYLLLAVIHHHLRKHSSPLCNEILLNIYMDNIFVDAESNEDAIKKYHQIVELFRLAGMDVREWASNIAEFNHFIKTTTSEDMPDTMKLLGLFWTRSDDTFAVKLAKLPPTDTVWTLSKLISFAASTFDPLGIVAPITIKIKTILQRAQEKKPTMHEPLDDDNIADLKICLSEWTDSYPFPRSLPKITQETTFHIFSDASGTAFGACIYIQNPKERAQLVSAVSRLQPSKKLSTPKAELVGILTGCLQLETCLKTLNITNCNVHLWSDSSSALHWITNPPPTIFIRNRVLKIRNIIDQFSITIHHVAGHHNPADLLSRGTTPKQLLDADVHTLWMNGPHFISLPSTEWPSTLTEENAITQRQESQVLARTDDISNLTLLSVTSTSTTEWAANLFSKTNSLTKILSSLTLILQFIALLAYRTKRSLLFIPHFETDKKNYCTSQLIKDTQQAHPPTKDQIRKHRLYQTTRYGVNGIYVSHKRTATIRPDPVYLPSTSRLAELVILDLHTRNLHCGTTSLLALLRSDYFIPFDRQLTKTVIRNCPQCRLTIGEPFELPPYPDLPMDRLNCQYPFEASGIDYTGALYTASGTKFYIILVTCLTTRAVFLDIVEDLSTRTFLNSLRRLIAVYGSPRKILCDNQTSFTLASKILQPSKSNNILKRLSSQGIEFHFISPLSPWKGSTYERMIGLMKNLLTRSTNRKLLSLDEMRTLILEIANILNNRPLVAITAEPSAQPHPLAPIDFIMPNRGGDLVLPDYDDDCIDPTTRKEQLIDYLSRMDDLLQRAWKQFMNDYTQELARRNTHNHGKQKGAIHRLPQVGEAVLVIDKGSKRNDWKCARVVELSDSKRTATVKSSSRTFDRPLNLLIPIELNPATQNTKTNISQQIPNHQSSHPMITRSKVTTLLTIAALATLLTPATAILSCPYKNTVLYYTPCTKSSLIITTDGQNFCHEIYTCKGGYIKPHQEKLPLLCSHVNCDCPTWAHQCTSYSDSISETELQTYQRILRLNNPHILCSTHESPTCSPTKQTASFAMVQLPTKEIFPVKELRINTPQRRSINDYLCVDHTGKKTKVLTDSRVGTRIFCEEHNCSEKSTPTSFCFYPDSSPESIFDQGTVPIIAWGIQEFEYYPHLNKENEHEHGAKVNITCKESNIILQSENEIEKASICLNDYCKLTNLESSTNNHIIPANIFTDRERTFEVSLWKSGAILFKTTTICYKNQEGISHYLSILQIKLSTYTLYSLLPLPAIILFILILMWFLKPLISLISSLRIIIMFIVYLPLRILLYPLQYFIRRRTRTTRTNIWNPRTQLITISLLFLPMNVSACMTITTMTGLSEICTKEKDSYLCTVEGATRLTLQPIGSEACFLLYNDGSPIGRISVTLRNVKMSCKKDVIYYTRDHAFQLFTSHRCSGAGSCEGQKCAKVDSTTIVDEFPLSIRSYPGITYCHNSCGCVTCNGCFLCDASCLFSRLYITPTTKTVYEIFRCPTWDISISADIRIEDEQQSIEYSLNLNPGEPTQLTKFMEITITSHSLPPLPLLNYEVLRDTKKNAMSLVRANNQHSLHSGLGQVQCTTRKEAELFKCKFGPEICSCANSDFNQKCSCPSGSIKQYLNNNPLPLRTSGILLLPSDGNIEAKANIGVIEAVIHYHNYSLKVIRENHSCDITILSLIGHHSSLEGATLNYRCDSTTTFVARLKCETETIYLQCGNSNSRLLQLNMNQEHISMNCRSDCSNEIIKIQGDLLPPASITMEDSININEERELKESNWWPNLLHLFYIYYFFVIICCIIFIIVFGVTFRTYRIL